MYLKIVAVVVIVVKVIVDRPASYVYRKAGRVWHILALTGL